MFCKENEKDLNECMKTMEKKHNYIVKVIKMF